MSDPKTVEASELPQKTVDWIEKSLKLKPRSIIEIKPLNGSTSSLVYNISFKTQEGRNEAVLRLFNNQQWLEEEPDIARHEVEALDFAFENKINSPKVLGADLSGEYCIYPAILMSKLSGSIILRPQNYEIWISGLARTLSEIHLIKPQGFNFKYFTYNNLETLKIPLWSAKQKYWQKLIDFAKCSKPKFVSCFIHRDYHPANILWKDNNVSGVVDWPGACLGPAGVDVGHARVNLTMLAGVNVAEQFLESYQKHMEHNFAYEPYWDIISLLDIGVEDLKLYPGWAAFSVNDLTDQIIRQRVDEYAVALCAKI